MPTLTLQAMPGQFLHLVAWDDSGRECARLSLEPDRALRLAVQLLEAALAERGARRLAGAVTPAPPPTAAPAAV